MCPKISRFMRNHQVYNDKGILLINIWIEIQFENFHAKLKYSDGVRHYNIRVGSKTLNRRLQLRILRQIILTDI